MTRILAILFAILTLASCTYSAERRAPPRPSTTVTVDRRIELISIVQLLGNYHLVTSLDHDYKSDARRFFAAHANHRAVTMFREMSARDFNFSEVPTAILGFGPPPELAPRRRLSAQTLTAAGGETQLLTFIDALRNFSRESDFDTFYASHLGLYEAMVSRAQPTVDAVINRLEAYLGGSLGDTYVVLGPLLHDGGFAATYSNEAGQPEVFAFIGPQSVSNGIPDFGNAGRLEPLIAHEFAHSVVNPLTARHAAQVQAKSRLHAAIASRMLENGYGTWEQVVYEHIIRAITVRLTSLSKGEGAGQAAMDEEVRRGFIHVPALVRRLEVYERHRERYPRIDDYFAQLLGGFA